MDTAPPLTILTDLRRQAGLSQSDMARMCGLRGRRSHQTAGAWERGDFAPDPRRRTDFIHYLWDGLGLRRQPQQFEEVWAMLAAQWGWETIDDEEWRSFTNAPRPSWAMEMRGERRIPFQAPPLTGHFLGRQRQQQQLQSALLADAPLGLVALTGMGGIGKTTLASHAAHALRSYFGDGVLWCNLSVSESSAVLDSWGQAYGYDFSRLPDVASKAAAFRDLTASRRLLLVIDDALSVERVTPLLPGNAACAVLLTTRSQEVAHALHAQVIQLDPLEAESSLALLTQIVGAARVEREPEAAQSLCALLDHLPLAVEIAGQRLRTRPERRLADSVERLGSVQTLLGELHISDRAVRSSFEASWQGLSPDLQRNFARLALFASRPFGVDAFAALSGLIRYDAEERLFTLAALSLLIDAGGRLYRLHPLLAEFAREKFANDGDADDIRLRFAHYFGRVAQTEAAQLSLLAPEWDHLRAGMAAAHSLRAWDLVIDYAEALSDPWRQQGRFTAAREGLDWATESARAVDDPQRAARFLQEWGFAALEQDDYAAAAPLLIEAAAIFGELGEEKDQADTLLLQARMAVEQEDYARAEAILRACWAIFAGMDEGRGLGRTLYWQGLVYYYQGRYADAKTVHAQARSLQETLGEDRDLAATLRALADIAIEEKAYAEAADLCESALRLAQSLGDHGEQAAVFYLLAVIADCQQRWDLALIHADKALAHFERIGDRGFYALTLYQQSQIQMKLGDYGRAEALILRSRRLVEDQGQEYTLIFVLFHLARIYAATHRRADARATLSQALARAEENRHPLVERLRQQIADLT